MPSIYLLRSVSALLISGACCLIPFSTTGADRKKEEAAFTKYERYYSTYIVNADGTHVETHEKAVRVLAEQGIEEANSTSIRYSERLQDAEILEAYTLKAD